MDYEKKYNEALERARRVYRNYKNLFPKYSYSEDIENIFPELRESEDERIRKVIFNLLLGMREEIFTSQDDIVTKEKALAYLEKQKEQKLAPDDLQKSFEAGQKSIVDNPEQYGLCKKAEWSKEDEEKIGRLRSVVNQLASYTDSLDVNGDYCEGDYAELDTWLKSLRPQPKPEVTDEEIEEMVTRRSRSTGTTKSEMDFYRNGIKDAIKQFGFRPSWKPSKEQMKVLDEAFMKSDNEKYRQVISSLYYDLKNL